MWLNPVHFPVPNLQQNRIYPFGSFQWIQEKEVHRRLEMIWNPDFPIGTEKPIFPKFEPNLFENRNSSPKKMGFFWNEARKIKQAGNPTACRRCKPYKLLLLPLVPILIYSLDSYQLRLCRYWSFDIQVHVEGFEWEQNP